MEQLLFVILGALIGIKGSEYKHQLDIKREDKKFYRGKLEQFIVNLFKVREQILKYEIKISTSNKYDSQKAYDLDEAQMLLALYFSETADDFNKLDDYLLSLMKISKKHINKDNDNKNQEIYDEWFKEYEEFCQEIYTYVENLKEKYSDYL